MALTLYEALDQAVIVIAADAFERSQTDPRVKDLFKGGAGSARGAEREESEFLAQPCFTKHGCDVPPGGLRDRAVLQLDLGAAGAD